MSAAILTTREYGDVTTARYLFGLLHRMLQRTSLTTG
jgi:hypothetical protein